MNVSTQLIDSLLRQADIEGLIQAGAPSDEYSSEAEVISLALAQLEEAETIEESIALVISEVWKESFDLSDTDMEARQYAINLLTRSILQNTHT